MSDNDSSKPISPLAIIPVILLCLGGGGWMVHWYVATGDLSRETSVLDSSVPGTAPVIEKKDANLYWLHVREADAQFVRAGADKPFTVGAINYISYQFVPESDVTLIRTARRLRDDTAMRKTMNLTPDQLKQLAKLTGRISMVTTAADDSRLLGLWNEYMSGSNQAATQAKLVHALGDIAEKSMPATAKAAADRAAAIRAVLTDTQWKQFEGMNH